MSVLKLKEFREKLNLNQREIAKMLNITQAYYWCWETGKNFPNAKQILELCKIFKCTPNELYGIKGDFTTSMEFYDHN